MTAAQKYMLMVPSDLLQDSPAAIALDDRIGKGGVQTLGDCPSEGLS